MGMMHTRAGVAIVGLAFAMMPVSAMAQNGERALADACNASRLTLLKRLSGASNNVVFSARHAPEETQVFHVDRPFLFAILDMRAARGLHRRPARAEPDRVRGAADC